MLKLIVSHCRDRNWETDTSSQAEYAISFDKSRYPVQLSVIYTVWMQIQILNLPFYIQM